MYRNIVILDNSFENSFEMILISRIVSVFNFNNKNIYDKIDTIQTIQTYQNSLEIEASEERRQRDRIN